MKRIVIIGAGFGGLAAAKALRHAKAEIWVIDRANHNLFQPLLYQVATTVLSPAQIASPIRELLKNQRNASVFLGEVTGINKDVKFVYVSNEDHKDAPIRYDILIVATGVTHSYFGHDEFAKFAPGLKGLADALHIRNKVLQAFEQAEAEEDPRRRLRSRFFSFMPRLVVHGPPFSNCHAIRQRDSLGEFATRPCFGYLGSRRRRLGAPVFVGAQHPPLPGPGHRLESPG